VAASEHELRADILDAYERGDQHTLRRLQAEYRRAAWIDRPVGVTLYRGKKKTATLTTSTSATVVVDTWPKKTPSDPNAPAPARSVVVTAEAYRALTGDPELGTGVERGFALLGEREGNQLVVCELAAVARDAYSRRCELDDELIELARERAARFGLDLLGDLHTHSTPGPAIPSRSDERAWRAGAQRWRRRWLGMIACPAQPEHTRDDGWAWPKLTAWLSDGRRAVPVPVTVEPPD
jgi:hypothetical protein